MRLNLSPATYKLGAMVLLGALLPVLGMGAAWAQTRTFAAPVIAPVPAVPPGFDITGFIQEATLDTSGAICNPTHARLAGGTVTLNGQKVIVPCNTILQLPAATMTWADLFKTATGLAPADIAPVGQTGRFSAAASSAVIMAIRASIATCVSSRIVISRARRASPCSTISSVVALRQSRQTANIRRAPTFAAALRSEWAMSRKPAAK